MSRPPFGPGRPRRHLFDIWRGVPGAIPESFSPTAGPYTPGSESEQAMSRVRVPPVEIRSRDDQPSIAAEPSTISLSRRGPWGPWSSSSGTGAETGKGAETGPQSTFDISATFDEQAFRDQIRDILTRGFYLPSEFTPVLKGIAEAAENILACMLSDPADVVEGERFLRRYLPAITRLIQSYRQIAEADPDKQRVAEVAEKTLDTLKRLETAFNKEHADLLRNDVLSLSADLNTIDRLLKMEGR